jgi:hypothetical protein
MRMTVIWFTFLLATGALKAEACTTGTASQYAPGIMQSVIRMRQAGLAARGNLPKELPEVDGFIAVENCGAIGHVWFIEYKGKSESFLVVDCAGDLSTRQWMQRNHISVEVDYETAVRWGVVGRAAQPVVVCDTKQSHPPDRRTREHRNL